MIQNTYSSSKEFEEFKFLHWNHAEEITLCAFRASHSTEAFAQSVSAKEAFTSCKIQRRWEAAFETLALLLGVPGNIMAAVTALSMDRGTTSNYIFFMSVGDLFTLLARAATPYTAIPSFELFKLTVPFFPNSILVLIVLERFMAVRYPWKKKRWFTVESGHMGVVVLLGLYILMLVIWIRAGVRVSSASSNFAISTMLFVLSCPFIIILNILTIKRLRYMAHLGGTAAVSFKSWSRVESSITYIMVLASAAFLVLNGPFFAGTVVWFLFTLMWTGDPLIKLTNTTFILKSAYWLTFLHHAINFYIYVLGTKRFRLQCIVIMKAWMPGVIMRYITPSTSHAILSALYSLRPSTSHVTQNFE